MIRVQQEGEARLLSATAIVPDPSFASQGNIPGFMGPSTGGVGAAHGGGGNNGEHSQQQPAALEAALTDGLRCDFLEAWM